MKFLTKKEIPLGTSIILFLLIFIFPHNNDIINLILLSLSAINFWALSRPYIETNISEIENRMTRKLLHISILLATLFFIAMTIIKIII